MSVSVAPAAHTPPSSSSPGLYGTTLYETLAINLTMLKPSMKLAVATAVVVESDDEDSGTQLSSAGGGGRSPSFETYCNPAAFLAATLENIDFVNITDLEVNGTSSTFTLSASSSSSVVSGDMTSGEPSLAESLADMLNAILAVAQESGFSAVVVPNALNFVIFPAARNTLNNILPTALANATRWAARQAANQSARTAADIDASMIVAASWGVGGGIGFLIPLLAVASVCGWFSGSADRHRRPMLAATHKHGGLSSDELNLLSRRLPDLVEGGSGDHPGGLSGQGSIAPPSTESPLSSLHWLYRAHPWKRIALPAALIVNMALGVWSVLVPGLIAKAQLHGTMDGAATLDHIGLDWPLITYSM